MMVSRENYEIWMIDYLDGNLSEADQDLLFRFLDENPELKSELEGLDNTILKAPESHFEEKPNLLKTEADALGVSYAEYIAIKAHEEGLSQEETDWRDNYLQNNKKSAAWFNAYLRLKLKADLTIIFKAKTTLKRSVLIPWVNQSTIRKISAAAVIAILLSVGGLPFLKDNSQSMQTVVVNDPPSLIKLPASKDSDTENISEHKENPKQNKVLQISTEKSDTNTTPQQQLKREFIAPITTQPELTTLKVERINAYEAGLNAMMPIMIARSQEERMLEEENTKTRMQKESLRLSRSSRALASGVKVLNFISGNDTQVKKYLNQDGELVAYKLESDNISISRKVKSDL
ncbi:hypothetical protein E9993_04735 [Labilibacter sediminis]|nr:hypothetical protein E9993_04735 [Labilibacter sediminis]